MDYLPKAVRKEALCDKQKEPLKGLDLGTLDFNNVDTGKEILRGRLKSVPVLLVLDDVDHTDQLDALLPDRDSLGRGSLIIVTTRELRVLKAWVISVIYNIRALNAAHAKELFCWHAFGQPSPLLGFEDLAEKFIHGYHGLPLSLKLFGGLLCGEYSKKYWQSQLDKVSRTVPDDIKLRLRISYDALDEEEKEMLLDVACFFIGERSGRAITVWDSSGWNGLHGWQRLVNKCLVQLDEYNLIRMHDHLRDLGREIANKQSPYRLWSKTQIIKIQPQQAPSSLKELFVSYAFELEKIENLKSLTSLEELRIYACPEFYGLLGLGESISLRKIELKWCGKLQKIESFKSLTSLEELRIHDCPELDGLPGLRESTSLRIIELTGCHKLQNIEGLESLTSLETFKIKDCI